MPLQLRLGLGVLQLLLVEVVGLVCVVLLPVLLQLATESMHGPDGCVWGLLVGLLPGLRSAGQPVNSSNSSDNKTCLSSFRSNCCCWPSCSSWGLAIV